MTAEVTLVSSYYRIPSKHSHTKYEEWIDNFMTITATVPTVIYGDDDSLSILQAKYPPSPTRRYELRPFSTFATSRWNWEKEVETDPETAIGHNARLYQVWAEKIFMVADTIRTNPFHTTKFIWCDIGCFRNRAWLPHFMGFPHAPLINADQVSILQLEPFTAEDFVAVSSGPLTDRFKNRVTVGGTMFGGGASALLQFRTVYAALLDEADICAVFKGKDQNLYAWLTLKYPELFYRIQTREIGYDSWFALHWMWSPPAKERLRIVLVGPGIMPIPPRGWGACEILIWNYACALRAAGHTVEIINTADMTDVVDKVVTLKPDFVHIHYDDHAWLAPLLAPHTRGIGITSHYGYLEQPHRWGAWRATFQQIIEAGAAAPNIYHLVLSAGIRDLYVKRAGVPPAKVFVIPNGADATQFRYKGTPLYRDRTICVGKLEARKGQHFLVDNSEVWFAGNHGCDGSFPPSHPRWLGEWDKTTLYRDLTEYANLVLLSEGEADPLVVKEALVAGLGVVVTPAAAANLDLSQTFITVVPTEKLKDKVFVAQAITENRKAALENREAIREYGIRNFHWDSLVGIYLHLLSSLLSSC